MEVDNFYSPDQVISGQCIEDGIVWTVHIQIQEEPDFDFWLLIN
jgi:hypothetical protein